MPQFGKKVDYIKITRLTLLSLGIITIIFGFFATGPRLAQFVADHLSKDKVLSEETISTLYGIRAKIFLLGGILVLFALLTGLLGRLINLIVKNLSNILEKTISSIGRFLDILYNIGTNEKFVWGLIILILLTISVPAIFLSPAGGFHVEGVDLQPAKNFAKYGIYATLTNNGFDEFTYRSSAGPGIVFPIALVFKIFGINVYYGRMVHLLFVIGTIIMFYVTARNIFGKKVALLALMLSFTPYMIMLSQGDNGMGPEGYIPSIFYLLVGAYFWFKSIESKKNFHLIISGIFWALAFQTKWLFLFAIFALVITCIILWLSNHSLKSKYYLIPAAMVLLVTIGWTLFRIFDVGIKAEVLNLQEFWGEHGHRGFGEGFSLLAFAHPLITAFTSNVAKVDFWGELQLFLIIPAFIYVIILLARSKWTNYRILFLLSFALIWILWWALFNFDLPGTHLKVFLIISQIFVAKFLFDIWEYSIQYKDRFLHLTSDQKSNGNTLFYPIRLAIIIIVISKVVLPIIEKADFIYGSYDTLVKPYHEMEEYIKNNTEKDAIFSGWNWSMPWYLDLDPKVDRPNKDREYYPFDQREKVPEYFIVSPEWPMVKTTEEWPAVSEEDNWSIKSNEKRIEFLKQDCTLLKTFGGPKFIWRLYKVNNKDLAQQLSNN